SGFQNGTHRAAGDNTGTFGGGHQEYPGGTESREQRILDRGPEPVHRDHVTTSSIHVLLDGSRHCTIFAATEAQTNNAVANYCQRCEGKDPTAFDYLGDAVNLNQLLNVTFVTLLIEISHSSTLRIPARLHERRRPALSRGHDT